MTRLVWSRRTAAPRPTLPTPHLHLALLDGPSFSRLGLGTPHTPYILPAAPRTPNPLEQLRSGLDANYSCFSTVQGCSGRTMCFATEKQRPLLSRVNTILKSGCGVAVSAKKCRMPTNKVSVVCGKASAVVSPAGSSEGSSPPWSRRTLDVPLSRQTLEVEDAADLWSGEWETARNLPVVEKKLSFARERPREAVTPLKAIPLWSACDVAEDDMRSVSSERDWDTALSEFGSVLHTMRKISKKISGGKTETKKEGNEVMMFEDDFISFACKREADSARRGRGRFKVKGILAKVMGRF